MKITILTRHDDEDRARYVCRVCLDHKAALSMPTKSLSHAMMVEPPGLCCSSREKINKCQSKLSGYATEDRRRGQEGSPPGSPPSFTLYPSLSSSTETQVLAQGFCLAGEANSSGIKRMKVFWIVGLLISSLWLHQSAGLWTGISQTSFHGSLCDTNA